MTNEWHKVSPVAIIYFIFSIAVKLVKDIGFNMMPAIVIVMVSVEDKLFWTTVVALLSTIFIIVGSILFYFNFRYRVCDDEIVVHRGVLKKEDISLKFDRIQNINLSTPWYFAAFNLVNCIVDSAGSKGKEISIPGIDKSFADSISNSITQYQNKHSSHGAETEKTAQDNIEPTLKLSPIEIIKYSFTNGMVILFAAAAIPVIEKVIKSLDFNAGPYLKSLIEYLPLPYVLSVVLVFGILLIFALSLLMIISAITALIRYHRFEFYNEPKQLRRIAGLLERHQISIKKQKIQGLTIKQNVMAKLMNRVTILVHQTQAMKGRNAAKQNFIIPTLHPDQWQDYAAMIFSDFKPQTFDFQPIEKQYLKRNFAYFVFLPLIIITTYLTLTFNAYHLAWLLFMPFGWLVCHQKYKRYGVWYDENYVIIRRGFIGVRYTVFPHYKVQQLSLIQTPLQRSKSLLGLRFQLAFVQLSIPYLNQQWAESLANYNLFKVQTTDKKWL